MLPAGRTPFRRLLLETLPAGSIWIIPKRVNQTEAGDESAYVHDKSFVDLVVSASRQALETACADRFGLENLSLARVKHTPIEVFVALKALLRESKHHG